MPTDVCVNEVFSPKHLLNPGSDILSLSLKLIKIFYNFKSLCIISWLKIDYFLSENNSYFVVNP